MPDPLTTVDDWTRVDAGTFHDFHQTFLVDLKRTLMGGLLPPGFYAHVERGFGAEIASENEGDLLTLQSDPSACGGTAVLDAPPATAVEVETATLKEAARYAAKADRLAIKRNVDHRVVALLELASPGNKDRPAAVDRFVGKLADALDREVAVVLIDLHPPTRHAPRGLHGALLEEIGGAYDPPAGKPLAAAGWRTGPDARAYVQPLAAGDPLPTVPLFLSPDRYVTVPLAPDYAAARRSLGAWWVEVLNGARPPVL